MSNTQEPLSAAEIAEMKRLEEAASAGWQAVEFPLDGMPTLYWDVTKGSDDPSERYSVFEEMTAEDAAFIAAARAFIPRALAMIEGLQSTNQRLADLVRYQRMELHQTGLITNEEYAEIIQNPGAVNRLGGYDEIKAERDQLRAENIVLSSQAEGFDVQNQKLRDQLDEKGRIIGNFQSEFETREKYFAEEMAGLRAEVEQLRESFREKEPCGHSKNFLIGDDWGHFSCVVCENERLKVELQEAEKLSGDAQLFESPGDCGATND